MWPPSVPSIAQLANIPPSLRTDGLIRFARDTSNDTMHAFEFRSASTATQDGFDVIQPATGTGRWHRCNSIYTYSRVVSVKPSTAPTKLNEVIIQNETDRTVIWLATGTSAATDWKAVGGTPILGSGNPSGTVTPDYIGQEYKNTSANTVWRATGLLDTNWVSEGGSSGGGGGFSIKYNFETTTSTPPSSGAIRLNNATPASVTQIYVSETDADSINIAPLLTESLTNGSDILVRKSDGSEYYLYTISGSVTDSGSYRTIPVTYSNAVGSLAAADVVFLDTLPQASSSLAVQEEGVTQVSAANTINVVSPYITVDSPSANTARLTFGSTQLTQLQTDSLEWLQDSVGAMSTGGTQSGIVVTYNDTTGVLNYSVGSSIVALTDGATINTNAALGSVFRVTLGGNRTLANPTGLTSGQRLTWIIQQDGTGSRTLTYGSKFVWPSGTAPTLTTTAGYKDIINGIYDGGSDLIFCTIAQNYADTAPFEAETTALLARFTGSYSGADQTAINTYIAGLKNNSLWTGLKLWVFAAKNVNDSLLNWTSTSYTAQRNAPSSLTFTADRGYTSLDSNGFILSNYIPSGDSANADGEMGLYVRATGNNTAAYQSFMGARSNTNSRLIDLIRDDQNLNSIFWRFNAAGGGGATAVAAETRLLMLARSGSTEYLYRSGTEIANRTNTAASAPVSTQLYVMSVNDPGGSSAPPIIGGEVAMAFYCSNVWTPTQIATFNTLTTNYLTYLGANV